MTWVQLLRGQIIEKAGVARQYHPGDWVDVGKQTAQRWVIDGVARFHQPTSSTASLDGCGIAVLGDKRKATPLLDALPKLSMESVGKPELPFAKTLLWDTSQKLRPELVSVGFGLLDTWEVACPLFSYEQLAIHTGNHEERQRTEEITRDLRVPLYESRMVFVKRCRAGEVFVEAWARETTTDSDTRLAFLRALYTVKPLICALPVTWVKAA